MAFTTVKKSLQELSKEQLISLMGEMYKKHKSVQEYLDYFSQPNEKEAFEKYKEKVVQAFFPKRGFNFKLADGKKAISDFKKLKPAAELVAELTLIFAEQGVRFTLEYGDIDERFYLSVEGAYEAALKLMKAEGCLAKFEARAQKLMTSTRNIGWGFHDTLTHFYHEYYSE